LLDVVRRRVHRVEAKRLLARVQHVVLDAGRNDDRVPGFEGVHFAVERGLRFATRNRDHLLHLAVGLRTDVLIGQQGHHHELHFRTGVEHAPK